MRLRHVARRLLDPWAGLLFAVLIVLGVIILLALPGPWRTVIGPEASAPLAVDPPSDIAVFVLAGPAGARCSTVAWLHVERDPAAVTVVVVPPRTRGFVPGGGYAPIRRLVTDLDPQTATDALGDALGTDLGGWVTLDKTALDRLLLAARWSGDEREGLRRMRAAAAALSRAPGGVPGLRRQQGALEGLLHELRYEELKANALVNYVLGSEDVTTDMDLRSASALASALRSLRVEDASVRTAAAIVETCGAARSWRLDESRLAPLRLSLALGLAAPDAAPHVAVRPMHPEVLVATRPGADGAGFARRLHEALVEGGALAHDVRALTVSVAAADERLATAIVRRRPIAVVFDPWGRLGRPEPSTTPTETPLTSASESEGEAWDQSVIDDLEAGAEALRRARQPAVLVAPPVGAPEEVLEAAAATGLPLVGTAGQAAGAGAVSWSMEGLVATVVARTCWPTYLAPGLSGSRLEFSYAARLAIDAAVVTDGADGIVLRLSACGFRVSLLGGPAWSGPSGPAVAFRPGARRAALTLAGDLGWPPTTLMRDPDVPATVTIAVD